MEAREEIDLNFLSRILYHWLMSSSSSLSRLLNIVDYYCEGRNCLSKLRCVKTSDEIGE